MLKVEKYNSQAKQYSELQIVYIQEVKQAKLAERVICSHTLKIYGPSKVRNLSNMSCKLNSRYERDVMYAKVVKFVHSLCTVRSSGILE